MAQFMISVFHQPGVQSAGAAYGSEEDMQAAFAAVTQFNADLPGGGPVGLRRVTDSPGIRHHSGLRRAGPPGA